MKTLVLYESRYGSTKKYAEDIANRVGADVFPLKKFKWKTLPDYQIVIFGGWIKGGEIIGLNKFLQHWKDMEDNQSVIVFGSGMSIPTKDTRALLIEQNLLDLYHLRFYQFRGTFDFQKLKFPDNFIINQSIAGMARDPANEEKVNDLNWVKSNPINYYDQEKVDKVCQVIQDIRLGTAKQ